MKLLWNRKPDTRPHWEVMADDGMNKFLKFCVTCVFLWMGYQTVIALIDRFPNV
jgi:bacteriorhodopsin